MSSYGGQNGASSDPNAILNECKDIDRGIENIESNLETLRMLQQRTLDDADSSASSTANQQLESLSTETMALYRTLTERVRTVKSNPESQSAKNSPQVGRVDRRLKAAIQQYQSVESQFRKRTQEQMARQYRIVRPEATDEEVRAAVEDTSGGQIFSQAMMQSDRQGRARAALSAVQDRHRALQKIEQQMVELSQLFQDMDTLVVQQESMVVDIEQKGEEVVENLDKGNQEIHVAVDTARATRKKKWWCLGICGKQFICIVIAEDLLLTFFYLVAIIVVIAIIVGVWYAVTQVPKQAASGGKRKRDAVDAALGFITPAINSRIVGRHNVGQLAQMVRDSASSPSTQ